MGEKLFYTLDEPYGNKDQRKKCFVAVRMEKDLFHELMEKAHQDGTDLSSTIRGICRNAI